MKTKSLFFILILGLGLTSALLWLLGNHQIPSALAQSGTGAIRVATTGADTLGCGSVATPCRTVQYAINEAVAGDNILVATGVYTDATGTVATITSTLTLQGGWNNSFTAQDSELYPTTLDAQGLGRTIYVDGLAAPSSPITPTIDGFVVIGGVTPSQGGGMYFRGASPSIFNNVITANVAGNQGGGIYISGQSIYPTAYITGNLVANNVASSVSWGYGGGIYINNLSIVIQDNALRNNIASTANVGNGGGIYLTFISGKVDVNNNTIVSNTASTASFAYGGGLYLAYVNGEMNISSNTIISNTSSSAGFGRGGGIYTNNSSGLIQSNTLRNNMSSVADWGTGGGLDIWASGPLTITNNLIEGNFATTAPFPAVGAGGAIRTEANNATILIRDNVIHNNVAALYGWGESGGFYARNDDVVILDSNLIEGNIGAFDHTTFGGGVYLESSDAIVRNNTIRDNQASNMDGYGAGLFVYLSAASLEANTIISNTAALSTTTTGKGQGGGVALYASVGVSMTNNIIANNQGAILGPSVGAGIWVRGAFEDGSLPTNGMLLHNTIADNIGDGVWIGFGATLTLTNNIVAGHTVAITNTAPASVTLATDYTLFWNNGSVPISGTNPIFGDPAFVGGGDYHLTPGSAAIDAGIEAGVNRDIDGDLRPAGVAPDVGVDELISFSLSKTAPATATSGQPITYTLTVTNNNLFPVTNVVVSDTMPVGASYVSGGSYANGDVTWTIPSITSAGTAQVSFVVTTTTTITNSQYRVMTSAEGGMSGFGPAVVTTISSEYRIYLPLVLKQSMARTAVQQSFQEGQGMSSEQLENPEKLRGILRQDVLPPTSLPQELGFH